MTDLFISYAHKDQERANQIVQLLEKKGYSVWQDVHQIRAMERFTKEIMEGIQGGSIFLMLYSNAYFQSQYCDNEFGYAQSCQKILSCIILDEDCPWQGTEFCFPFSQLNVPGYGKTAHTAQDYQALCDQIDESPAFRMLRANSSCTESIPTFGDQAFISSMEELFEKSIRNIGSYLHGQKYFADLAMLLTKVDTSDEEKQKKSSKQSLANIIRNNPSVRIMVSGEGGLGKTTAMIEYGRYLFREKRCPAIYVHLPDVVFGSGDARDQYTSLEQYIRRICFNEHNWTIVREWAKLPASEKRICILLDGLNELSFRERKQAIKDIGKLADRWIGADIIVSTRNAETKDSQSMESFETYYAVPPEKDRICAYLVENHLSTDSLGDERMLVLLRNPLRLCLYAQISEFHQSFQKKMDVHRLDELLHDGKPQDTPGKLMDAYLASQLYKFLQMYEISEVNKPHITAALLGLIVIPSLGWKLYRENRFYISETEMRDYLQSIGDSSNNLLQSVFASNLINDLLWDFGYDDEDYSWKALTARNILDQIGLMQRIHVDNEPLYVFSHQCFRDYYAARYLALAINISLHNSSDAITSTLGVEEISDDVLSILSDILEEERACPEMDPLQGWSFPGKQENSLAASSLSPAEKVLDKLRGHQDALYRKTIKNLIELLRYARKNRLAQCDFSHLDLRDCILKKTEFSLWFKDQLHTSCFDNAWISHNSFFHSGHLNKVKAVLPCENNRLFSGDADGLVLERNLLSGEIIHQWKLCDENIRDIAWNDDKQQLLIGTVTGLFLLDYHTDIIQKLTDVNDGNIEYVRFGISGDPEYSLDIRPLVWYRVDGTVLTTDFLPDWLSGAYIMNPNCSRYWRSGMFCNIYTGKRTPVGMFIEKGGWIYKYFPVHASNCARLATQFSELKSKFPITKKDRISWANRTWIKSPESIESDPVLDSFFRRMRYYLNNIQLSPDEVKTMAARLRKDISSFLEQSPKKHAKRISSIDLSPDGTRILITCGVQLIEMDAETLDVINHTTLKSTANCARYLTHQVESTYAVVGWASNISLVDRDLSIIETYEGDYPIYRSYLYKNANNEFYLHCSDNGVRKITPDYRVSRIRILPHRGICSFYEKKDGGLQVLYPMAIQKWRSGEIYDYNTGQSTALRGSFYRHDTFDNHIPAVNEKQNTKGYFLGQGIQLISKTDPDNPRFIEYSSDLYVFGCSFRDVQGDMTDHDREVIYMNGGIIE